MLRRFPWLAPLILVTLIVGFMLVLAYFILRAAYDHDINQDAAMLGRRVFLSLKSEQPDVRAKVINTLAAEVYADPKVQAVFLVDLTTKPVGILPISRGPVTVTLTEEEIRSYAKPEISRTEDAEHVKIAVPFFRDNRLVAFTYIIFNREELRADFWNQEGPLLWRVLSFSLSAAFFIAAMTIIAYRSRVQLTTTQTLAQLQQQGLLAERGLTAAVLAHEIRNPLAALRFQLHSLKKTTDPQRIEQTAETIDGELLRIQQLVTDYLEHEKAATLRTQPVDLFRACQDLQLILSELLRSTGTQLVLAAPPVPVIAACDPHALRQVLMNLVLNAQQAMGRLGTITIAVTKNEKHAELSVSDNGPGLPEEIRQNLFKPFQTTKQEGTGIGLALVKRFADNFGGTVSVESSGTGTTFKLTLPLLFAPSSVVA